MSQSRREHHERWIACLMHVGGAAIAALAVVGFWAFAYRPLDLATQESLGRLEQLQMMLGHSTNIQREHRALREELAELRHMASSTRERIPAELLDIAFIESLKQIASEVGLTILEHELGQPQPLATFSQSELHVRCSGSYASVCRFLEKSEQLARITKVSQLELAATDKSDANRFLITFVLYYGVDTNDTNERSAVLLRNRR